MRRKASIEVGIPVALQLLWRPSNEANPGSAEPYSERRWFATFTRPQNEKSVLKHLDLREVESFLRAGVGRRRVEPFSELVIGEKVRIRSGIMQGVRGTLIRKSSSLRFVLTIEMINQHAAIEVDAEDIEPAVH
jgi:hypothetical protein